MLVLCVFLAHLPIALNGSSDVVLWTYHYQALLQYLQNIDNT